MKRATFIFVLFLATLAFSPLVFATNATSQVISATFLNRSVPNLINISVSSQGENITTVLFAIPSSSASYIAGSNGSTLSSSLVSFNNTTVAPGIGILNFSNLSNEGIVNTTHYFWFQIIPISGGNLGVTRVAANATGIVDPNVNQTIHQFKVNFDFTGYVRNATGSLVNGTNLTIYGFSQQTNGAPLETPLSSVLSDTSGFFNFTQVNGSFSTYVLRMIKYNDSGTAIAIGPRLPPLPVQVFYPQQNIGNLPDFMKPPTLNGTTFYLEPAGTINITARNGTGTNFSQLFGYMVMEQKTGFPVESAIIGNVSTAQVVVPLNRNFTVMAARTPQAFPIIDPAFCDGNFMNNTHCPSPPKSSANIKLTSAGQTQNVQFDLTYRNYNLYGCAGFSGNTSVILNVTKIIPRLVPWTGFVPPVNADPGSIDLSNTVQYNASDPRCPSGLLRWYNISLISADYLVEFYAANSTGPNPIAAFQNVSLTADTNLNVTLTPLAGIFSGTNEVNASMIRFTFVNASGTDGATVTNDVPHVEVYIKHSSFGQLTYVIGNVTNGSFDLPILADATAKVKVFPNQGPPREQAVNLSRSTNNITLIDVSSGSAGMIRRNSSGSIVNVNVSTLPINMRFLRAGGACDSLTPDSSCELSSMDMTSFNPFKLMVTSNINMEMKMTSSNTTLLLVNFDLFAAKQPPTNSLMNDNASQGANTNSQFWEFGSFVPSDVYDYAIVGIPYNDTAVNDSTPITVSIPSLLDENLAAVWNSSTNTTAQLPTDFTETSAGGVSYSSSGYSGYLTSNGVSCSTSDSSLFATTPTTYCFVNTTANIVYFRIPHFSGISSQLSGSAPSSSTAAASASSSSSDGGAGTSDAVEEAEETRDTQQPAEQTPSEGTEEETIEQPEQTTGPQPAAVEPAQFVFDPIYLVAIAVLLVIALVIFAFVRK